MALSTFAAINLLLTLSVGSWTPQPQVRCASAAPAPSNEELSAEEPPLDLSAIFFDFRPRDRPLTDACPDNRRLEELGDDCLILKLFNQTQVDLMDYESNARLAENCACQLIAMRHLWQDAFTNDLRIRRMADIVYNAITYRQENQTYLHPQWLWSDIDVTVYQISIYTSTRDFFYQTTQNASMAFDKRLKLQLDRNEMWNLTRRVCIKIAADVHSLYRYLENLNRLNPVIFFNLVKLTEHIDIPYSASKACKVLLLTRLNEYKLKPSSNEYVPVFPGPHTDPYKAAADSDNLLFNDIDQTFTQQRHTSSLLSKCNRWTDGVSVMSARQLLSQCPLLNGTKPSTEWLLKHQDSERSHMVISCGCQLLLFNSTWNAIMVNEDVKIMAAALTGYMNRNQVPDFGTTPIWTIHAWFEHIMGPLATKKSLAIQEVIIALRRNPDPTTAYDKDYAIALEIIRRGCMFVVYNYQQPNQNQNQSQNQKQSQALELKLLQYLDSLTLASRDPMFVFHLTLQDVNLFKVYGLSKMCHPFVRK